MDCHGQKCFRVPTRFWIQISRLNFSELHTQVKHRHYNSYTMKVKLSILNKTLWKYMPKYQVWKVILFFHTSIPTKAIMTTTKTTKADAKRPFRPGSYILTWNPPSSFICLLTTHRSSLSVSTSLQWPKMASAAYPQNVYPPCASAPGHPPMPPSYVWHLRASVRFVVSIPGDFPVRFFTFTATALSLNKIQKCYGDKVAVHGARRKNVREPETSFTDG